MENIAAERMRASDAGIREKIDAALVRTAMKAKRFFGWCLNINSYQLFEFTKDTGAPFVTF